MLKSNCHFTYPYCKSCLFHRFDMLIAHEVVGMDGERFITRHCGYKPIKVGHVFSIEVHGNVMTRDSYEFEYRLGGNVVHAIELVDEIDQSTLSCVDRKLFEYLSFCSFLSNMKQSSVIDLCNVKLVWCESIGRLVALRQIGVMEEFVLFNPCHEDNSNLLVDFNQLAVSYANSFMVPSESMHRCYRGVDSLGNRFSGSQQHPPMRSLDQRPIRERVAEANLRKEESYAPESIAMGRLSKCIIVANLCLCRAVPRVEKVV